MIDDIYEDRQQHCQEVVQDHTYRVITFRRCQNRWRWLVKGKFTYSGIAFEKKLCTRHKNELVKYKDRCGVEIESIEEIK